MKRVYTVQENGQVTLPIEFRRKHRLRKGDVVIFEETEMGLLISPAQINRSEGSRAVGGPDASDGHKDGSGGAHP